MCVTNAGNYLSFSIIIDHPPSPVITLKGLNGSIYYSLSAFVSWFLVFLLSRVVGFPWENEGYVTTVKPATLIITKQIISVCL